MIRLSYEPSVQAVLDAVLPPSMQITGDQTRLRHRVSWPLIARTTGLGQIQGGEVILVPPGRAGRVLPHTASLAAAGVVAVVVADEDPDNDRQAQDASLPIAWIPATADMRKLQADMEQFIIRRRRELFDLSQQMHRTLVEGAIGGMNAERLLQATRELTGTPVLLDRDGDVVSADEISVSRELLLEARIAVHASSEASVPIIGPPPSLAAPVLRGSERRGIVLLVDVDQHRLDEAEVILTTLSSACAIALSHEPASQIPSLHDLLSGQTGRAEGAQVRDEQTCWTGIAVRDIGVPAARLERSLAGELTARDVTFILARQGDTLVALAHAEVAPPWNTIVRSVQLRAASDQLVAGLGRSYRGLEGARQTAGEALEALERSAPSSLTRYEAVELEVLLTRVPEWQAFVRARLGPLLEANAGRRELLRTLEVYLGTGRNATEAARRLQVHRNTLLYRLARIRSVLDVDLEDPGELFALGLAVRLLAAHGGAVSESAGTG